LQHAAQLDRATIRSRLLWGEEGYEMMRSILWPSNSARGCVCETVVLLRVEHEATAVWRDEYRRAIAYLDEQEARAQQLAGDYLDQVVDSARKQWPGVPIHTNVQFGVPAARIAEVATTTGAALVSWPPTAAPAYGAPSWAASPVRSSSAVARHWS